MKCSKKKQIPSLTLAFITASGNNICAFVAGYNAYVYKQHL